MAKFHVGQLVELGSSSKALECLSAWAGARGTVLEIRDDHLRIKWDGNDPRVNHQSDGNYYSYRFIPIQNMSNDGDILEEILESQELYAKLTACE